MQNFSFKDAPLVVGIIAFLLNRFMDINLNLPVVDILLPFMAFALLYQQGSAKNVWKVPGLFLGFLLLVWITASNIAHGISFVGQLRNTYANIALIIPVFFFLALKDRRTMMSFFIGTIVGFCIYFTVLALIQTGQGNITRGLRADIPTPAVPLAIYFMFRNNMSKALATTLLGFTAIIILFSFVIEARGAILSIVMGMGIWVAARATPWPRIVLPAIVILGFMAHYVSSFYIGDSLWAVMNTDDATVSNMGRAYAIDYSRMVLHNAPWFGDSPLNYNIYFADFFKYYAGFGEEGDKIASPHNTFLEYGVFFGYPAAFLITLLVARLVHAGLVTKQFARTFAVSLACAGIIRQAALYGLSGILRVEWFALIMIILYFYEFKKPEEKPLVSPLSKKPTPEAN